VRVAQVFPSLEKLKVGLVPPRNLCVSAGDSVANQVFYLLAFHTANADGQNRGLKALL
jgi:hypothetical protein